MGHHEPACVRCVKADAECERVQRAPNGSCRRCRRLKVKCERVERPVDNDPQGTKATPARPNFTEARNHLLARLAAIDRQMQDGDERTNQCMSNIERQMELLLNGYSSGDGARPPVTPAWPAFTEVRDSWLAKLDAMERRIQDWDQPLANIERGMELLLNRYGSRLGRIANADHRSEPIAEGTHQERTSGPAVHHADVARAPTLPLPPATLHPSSPGPPTTLRTLPPPPPPPPRLPTPSRPAVQAASPGHPTERAQPDEPTRMPVTPPSKPLPLVAPPRTTQSRLPIPPKHHRRPTRAKTKSASSAGSARKRKAGSLDGRKPKRTKKLMSA